MSRVERDEIYAEYQASVDALRLTTDNAKDKGTTLFNKEHCVFVLKPDRYSSYVHGGSGRTSISTGDEEDGPFPYTNPSVLPDDLLRTFTPVFLIRHPVLTIASYARVAGRWDSRLSDDVKLQWAKELYSWYLEHGTGDAATPIILDADDVLRSPATLRKLAELIKLDPNKIVYVWELDRDEEKKSWHPVKVKMTKTLANSTGIVLEGKLGSEINIADEIKKWKVEFKDLGASVPADMAMVLTKEMLIYNFLKERRLKPDNVYNQP